MEEKVDEVAMFINTRLHKQVKVLTTEYQKNPSQYTSLNLRGLLDSLDPLLERFLHKITQSVRSRKRKLFENESDTVNHTVCQGNSPGVCHLRSPFLHRNYLQLLTEAILCHGGSLEAGQNP